MPSVPIDFLHPDRAVWDRAVRAGGRALREVGRWLQRAGQNWPNMWDLLIFMASLNRKMMNHPNLGYPWTHGYSIWSSCNDFDHSSHFPQRLRLQNLHVYWLFLGVWIDLLSSLSPECKLWQGHPGELVTPPEDHNELCQPEQLQWLNPEPPRNQMLWGWNNTFNINLQTVGWQYPCWVFR